MTKPEERHLGGNAHGLTEKNLCHLQNGILAEKGKKDPYICDVEKKFSFQMQGQKNAAYGTEVLV